LINTSRSSRFSAGRSRSASFPFEGGGGDTEAPGRGGKAPSSMLTAISPQAIAARNTAAVQLVTCFILDGILRTSILLRIRAPGYRS